jgi:dynamin 1-like protein
MAYVYVYLGDQPRDIEERIRSMCMEFISNPNAIILAVSSANQDLANSDGLKMAQSVDPDGDRTVGVLTKVDIMDHGTDCVDILNNKVIPLKKGYVAVVNRSQADIQKNLPIREGILKEQNYFQTHPRYRSVSSKCGTTNLARILNQILMKHIKEVLPGIKSRISEMIAEADDNIAQLGEVLPPERMGGHLLKLLSDFSGNFMNILEVKSHLAAISTKELYGGARISYIFKEHFGKGLTNLDALESLSDEDIRTVNANSSGLRPALLLHEMAFDLLVRKQIAKLEAPSLQCVDYVFDELLHIADMSCSEELKRFPRLYDCVRETVHTHLRGFLVPTQDMISNIIQAELGYLNTSHPDFIGGKAALAAAQQRIGAATHGDAGAPRPGSGGDAMSPPPAPAASTSPLPSGGPHAQGQAGATPVKPMGGFTMISGSLNLPAGSASAVTAIRGAAAAMPPGKTAGSAQPAQLQTAPAPAPGANNSSMTTSASTVSTSSGAVRLKAVPDMVKVSVTPTDRERLETEVIKILMQSYFDIVKKNVVDLVPKIVMHFLVNAFSRSIQNHLVAILYSDLSAGVELLREKDDLAEQRAQLREIRDMLQKALEIINEVRDYHVATSS